VVKHGAGVEGAWRRIPHPLKRLSRMYGLYGLVQRLAEGRSCEYNALHERLKLSKPLCMVMREVANGWCVCGAVKFLVSKHAKSFWRLWSSRGLCSFALCGGASVAAVR